MSRISNALALVFSNFILLVFMNDWMAFLSLSGEVMINVSNNPINRKLIFWNSFSLGQFAFVHGKKIWNAFGFDAIAENTVLKSWMRTSLVREKSRDFFSSSGDWNLNRATRSFSFSSASSVFLYLSKISLWRLKRPR